MKRDILTISITISMLIILCAFLQGARVAVLEDVFRPDMIVMSDKYVYITEKASIHILDAQTFEHFKTFGREGEGPREFKVSAFGAPMVIACVDDKLVVNSFTKVSIYTATGEFIRETRVPPNQIYIPFGDSYMYTGTSKNENGVPVISINLADASFKKKAELYLSDWTMGAALKFDFPITSFAFAPVDDKLFIVAGKEGFVIDVYGKAGDKLSRIKMDYSKRALPSQYKEGTLKWFKTDPRWKNVYDIFKERISFKSHYPPVYNMHHDKTGLYVLTYNMKGDDRECIVLDLNGKELKRVFLPVPEIYGMGLTPKYTFFDRTFYVLKENEDEEVYELHKIEI